MFRYTTDQTPDKIAATLKTLEYQLQWERTGMWSAQVTTATSGVFAGHRQTTRSSAVRRTLSRTSRSSSALCTRQSSVTSSFPRVNRHTHKGRRNSRPCAQVSRLFEFWILELRRGVDTPYGRRLVAWRLTKICHGETIGKCERRSVRVYCMGRFRLSGLEPRSAPVGASCLGQSI